MNFGRRVRHLPCGSCGPISTQNMTNQKVSDQREDIHFRILHLLEERPDASQREMAQALGVSLGAVNFCLRALVEKGHLKIANFRASKNKLGYVYVLTPEGISSRAGLSVRFIQRKLAEYDAIKAEIERLRATYRADHEAGPEQVR